jgi:rhodanese-related sulfurtransferase
LEKSALLTLADRAVLTVALTDGTLPRMKYGPAFDKLIRDAQARVKELSIDDVKHALDAGESFHFIDVREESEWATARLPKAMYLGRGILERDIETKVPDLHAKIVLYCGGGARSALSAENLDKMGYTKVYSMAGGFRGWKDKGYPVEG